VRVFADAFRSAAAGSPDAAAGGAHQHVDLVELRKELAQPPPPSLPY